MHPMASHDNIIISIYIELILIMKNKFSRRFTNDGIIIQAMPGDLHIMSVQMANNV